MGGRQVARKAMPAAGLKAAPRKAAEADRPAEVMVEATAVEATAAEAVGRIGAADRAFARLACHNTFEHRSCSAAAENESGTWAQRPELARA